MGTSGQQIERLEKGQRKLTTDWIDKAALAFGVAAGSIIEQNGSDDYQHGTGHIDEPKKRAAAALPDLPSHHQIDAGETAQIIRLDLSLPMGPGATVDDYVEEEPVTFDLGYIRTFTRTPPHRLRLAAGAGDSMFPTLVPNDLVWIDTTQNQLLHSDRIYAASINGGAAIKRLRPAAGGKRIIVISDNKTIEPYEVDAADVVIWGRVIRFARDL